jgi:maltooligosyltrehalose trehalohydrolase
VNGEHVPGAVHLGNDICRFTVWAPYADSVSVRLLSPHGRIIPLAHVDRGYHVAETDGVHPGDRYVYRLDDRIDHPDPASRHQPEGVNGPSAIISPSFSWTDADWRGISLRNYVIYELHVGTFTPEGTFDAVIPRLPELRQLGITAVEFMPVAQFPGDRNWGYDGVFPYAVQHSYGGPESLKRLVDACHSTGLAAILDVVYNHFGPEGNYAGDYGPYFTEMYRTPWGRAINFDGPGSDEVRRFFLENALHWLSVFHFDALRLDALHAILDTSATPFLSELSARVEGLRAETGRKLYLIGESDLNDPRLIRERARGGMGLDAQWSDDFHHALHTLLTSERSGYYADFGTVAQLASAWREGYSFTGQYSDYRQRRHGAPATELPPCRFVVCAQNHDQVGNRAAGDRLSTGISFESLKLAAACVLFSPHVPLLFMGEEYGETAPFPYFVHHSDPALIEAVRKGRSEEFKAFGWQDEVPDPQSLEAFLAAKLNWSAREQGDRGILLSWYGELLRLRQEMPLLTDWAGTDERIGSFESQRVMVVQRSSGSASLLLAFNFGDAPLGGELTVESGTWHRVLDSSDSSWNGSGGTIPETLPSNGQLRLNLDAHSVALLSHRKEP